MLLILLPIHLSIWKWKVRFSALHCRILYFTHNILSSLYLAFFLSDIIPRIYYCYCLNNARIHWVSFSLQENTYNTHNTPDMIVWCPSLSNTQIWVLTICTFPCLLVVMQQRATQLSKSFFSEELLFQRIFQFSYVHVSHMYVFVFPKHGINIIASLIHIYTCTYSLAHSTVGEQVNCISSVGFQGSIYACKSLN